MPLLRGKANFSRNVKTELAAGKPQNQAVAIAYREAGKDSGAMVTAPNAGIPMGREDDDGSWSVGDRWTGKRG